MVVGAILSFLGVTVGALIRGWFHLHTVRIETSSQERKVPLPNQTAMIQQGHENFQAGRDITVQNFYLGTRGREIPTGVESHAFIPLTQSLRQQVALNLRSVQQTHSEMQISIVISAQAGDAERLKLADELAEVFRSAGINAEAKSSIILSQERTPIVFTIHPEGRAYARAIGEALGPMLRTKSTAALKGKESRQRNKLDIDLLGQPVFLSEGVVVFK